MCESSFTHAHTTHITLNSGYMSCQISILHTWLIVTRISRLWLCFSWSFLLFCCIYIVCRCLCIFKHQVIACEDYYFVMSC